jgi:thiol:disulfide interchange protein
MKLKLSIKDTVLLFALFFSVFVHGQVIKPVKWAITQEKISDNEYYLVFKASISPGWTVYSQFTSDEGPVPTEIIYEDKSGIDLIGKAQESGYKKEGPDPLFDNVNVIKFLDKQPFVIKQKVKVKDASKPVKGYLTYMSCNNEKCLPPDDIDFVLKLDGNANNTTTPNTTTPSTNSVGTPIIKLDDTNSKNKTGQEIKDVAVAADQPLKDGKTGETSTNLVTTDTVAKTVTTVATGDNSGLSPNFVSSAKIENGIIDQIIASLQSSYKTPSNKCDDGKPVNTGLLWTFLFGFMGGLFALLTPCVFPMIPITVSFFTKDNRRKGWVNGVIYGISIIVIYVVLGLLITTIFGPEALNRMSTSWIANTLFFIIFIVFALSFFGYYEITLPSSWSTKSDQMADKGGLIGIFFMAFTLALVSFSCTGPIIGSALVSAASKGEYLGPFLVMFGFSLALALPFGLFAAFPSWLNSLPKSGSWMSSVKVVLGFLELALALKFLSVADMTRHWGFLKYELFMILWIIVFFAMALYLFGYIKFPVDHSSKKPTKTRLAFGGLAAALVLYLCTGFLTNEKTKSYNALSLMSGLAPPTNYNFFKPAQPLDEAIKAKYPSYSKGPNNINAFKDYYEGLAYAKETGKPILLDFTGYGCVNCRKTEEHIWVDDEIRNKLNDDMVLISLYVDDDKKLSETLVSKNSNKKIRNIGNLWADFQIYNFDQNSQPLYVIVDPKTEKVMTEPRPFKEGISGYKQFLNCGLQGYSSN